MSTLKIPKKAKVFTLRQLKNLIPKITKTTWRDDTILIKVSDTRHIQFKYLHSTIMIYVSDFVAEKNECTPQVLVVWPQIVAKYGDRIVKLINDLITHTNEKITLSY